MNQPSRYREIVAIGTPRELGRQIGELAGDEIRGFSEIALERIDKTISISREKVYDIAKRSMEFAECYRPDLLDELRGMGEAARVTIDDLMLLQVRNQLQPQDDLGCTSFSFSPAASVNRGSVVGQNWDNDPILDNFTIVLTRRPTGKPAFTTCTQAGLISYLGFNEKGIGACVNTLPAPAREVGVPHYFQLRELFEATSLNEAVHAVQRAHRPIAANIMLSTPQGPANLEITIDDVHVLRPEKFEWISHTNHCIHSDLLSINDEFPELIQSYDRKRRIDNLIASNDSEIELESIKNLLRDHQDYPTSICRHQNDLDEYGFWETVFSIILEPSKQRMHVSRGTPCNHPYETYGMLESLSQ